MVNEVKNNPLSILWVGKATIFEYKSVFNEETYQTKHELVQVVTDEPCRLSYKSYRQVPTVKVTDGVPYVTQTIVLFIRPDIEIKEGSVIDITQHGVTTRFKRSGKPAIYTNHQEVSLELCEDFA